MPFVKGQSGNPGGRPKELTHVRDLARVYTDEAIKTLAAIMRDTKAPVRARAAAAEILLSRAWGTPTQHVEVETTVRSMTDDQLELRIAELLGKAGARDADRGERVAH